MNINHRYLLPAFMAASLHVAFVLGFKHGSGPIRNFAVISLGDPVPDPVPEAATPPEETPAPPDVLRSAGGEPRPPEIDPPVAPPKSGPITVAQDEASLRPARPSVDVFPPEFGPKEGLSPGPGDLPGGPVSGRELDREPRATVQMQPDYPATMAQQGIAGSVTVEFAVDTEGRVVRTDAVRYTHREFAAPAVRAVMKWRFAPGRRHGRVVPFRMAVPIEFGLAAD